MSHTQARKRRTPKTPDQRATTKRIDKYVLAQLLSPRKESIAAFVRDQHKRY